MSCLLFILIFLYFCFRFCLLYIFCMYVFFSFDATISVNKDVYLNMVYAVQKYRCKVPIYYYKLPGFLLH